MWVTHSAPRSRSTSGVLLSTRGVAAWVALRLLTFTLLCLALMLKKEGPKEVKEWSSHRDPWRLAFCLCQQGSSLNSADDSQQSELAFCLCQQGSSLNSADDFQQSELASCLCQQGSSLNSADDSQQSELAFCLCQQGLRVHSGRGSLAARARWCANSIPIMDPAPAQEL